MSTFSFGNPASQQQPAAGGSLFGNNANNTAAKPFSFGQAANTPTTNTQPTTSLFGNTANNNTNSTAPATGGLFGSTMNPTTQPSTSSGGLFGSFGQQNTSQPAQQGGLFGQSTQNNQQQQQPQQQTSSLFGNTSTTAQPAQSTSLFGSTAAKPGGLFGSTNTGGGLFGQAQTQPAQQPTSSLFGGGAQPSTGLFGSTTQPQQQQQQGLGASTQAPQQPAVRSTLFESQSQPRTLFEVKNEKTIEERIVAVKNAWDPSNPDCQFKYYFYNVVAPGTAGQYARPQYGSLAEKYARAERENPDPQNMVPALAMGWDDIKKRSNLQEQLAASHQEKMNECSTALQTISRQSAHESTHRLQELQRRLTQLHQRLIRLAGDSLSLNPHFASTSYKPEEAQTKAKLVNVKSELDGNVRSSTSNSRGSGYGLPQGHGTPGRRKNGGEGRMSGQVNELWGLIEEIRRRRKASGVQSGDTWLADEKALEQVAQILSQHQDALDKLRNLVDENAFDVEVLDRGLKELGR